MVVAVDSLSLFRGGRELRFNCISNQSQLNLTKNISKKILVLVITTKTSLTKPIYSTHTCRSIKYPSQV
jgi:hypothetical protein